MSFACIKEGKEYNVLNFKIYGFVNHFYDIYVIQLENIILVNLIIQINLGFFKIVKNNIY